jgi:hypothetical protein
VTGSEWVLIADGLSMDWNVGIFSSSMRMVIYFANSSFGTTAADK